MYWDCVTHNGGELIGDGLSKGVRYLNYYRKL